MTDPSQSRKKRKITYAASAQGVEKADKALKRLGFGSKINFAKSNLLSRTTVTKFFQYQPIQLDSFKRICEGLTLDWKEIVSICEKEQSKRLEIHEPSNLDTNQGGEQFQTLYRKVTILDKQSQVIKAVVILEGDFDSINNNLSISLQAILREFSGDTIKITDIEEGSIRLIIEGSPEDIEKLISRFKLGELTEVSGFPVEDVQILNESSDEDESNELNDKWRLVQEIVSQRVDYRNLSGADLSQRVDYRNLSGADLSDADLGRANLSGADLSGADLSGATVRRADLSGADLSGASLNGADLSGADLTGADLNGADLTRADLSGANLNGADLNGADLTHANLSDADLRRADLSGADLRPANLTGADLRRANLSDADLRRANLTGADLNGADLNGADLRRANLNGADLRRANLSGADLSGANLSTADINDVHLIRYAPTSDDGAYFSRQNDLIHANLSDANLSGANLSGANLSGAVVEKALFRANLGLTEEMKFDLKQRGAIFEDSPGDRSGVLSHR
jgi:uncharacterized protein YjbI with pentapeptide repeats